MFSKKFFASTAVATLLATSAMAQSEGYFTYIEGTPQEDSSVVELGGVTADVDGTVVIYDYQGGEFGDMLGSMAVSAGANSDVRIDVDEHTSSTLAAVLYAGEPTTPEDAVDWVEIDISM